MEVRDISQFRADEPGPGPLMEERARVGDGVTWMKLGYHGDFGGAMDNWGWDSWQLRAAGLVSLFYKLKEINSFDYPDCL